ncbi:MAG: response regulator [Thermoguttaceae bacterium]|jgi:CheY-like chemotaxis protein
MKTVLYVDDDAASRELCRRILEDEGYRVLLAEDGSEAVEVVEAENPDVAILDIRMPQKDGLEAAEEISGIDATLPIILYTCNEEVCMSDRRAQYASACISKSLDFTELARAVGRAVSQSKQNASLRVGLPPR